ncbi:MAG: lipolytic enzyme, G-D-S-L, partial [Thermoguttaceae bacterium]
EYEYLESDWPNLFMNARIEGIIPVKDKGNVTGLLVSDEVARIRKTDGAFAIRYKGHIDVPSDGVYVFYAPKHLFDVTMDAGFDMRVWVDDEEWLPAPRVHAENTWSVALRKGPHRFAVVFVDFRYKKFKSEYWLPWQEEEVWQGIPSLCVSGPGIRKQPIPRIWLSH